MSQTSDKRIAKNTIVLYIQLFLQMAIGLYTSRVVLNTLGVSDFGLYNVVGGVVLMLAFLNSAMASASQRFISYELGSGNYHSLQNVFSVSIKVHVLLAIIVAIVLESVGYWFLNNKLVIPIDRNEAANWVFQCSIISFVLTIISVPYNSLIIAYEKMSAFAYITIFESILRLSIVFILQYLYCDKLVLYAILSMIVSIIIRFCYTLYCKIKIPSVKFVNTKDKSLFKQIFSFASWSVIGNIGFTAKDQLSNIVINLFCGTVVNAARGIASQVNSVVSSFASNFGMAVNPQITKSYAAGEFEDCKRLVFLGARIKFYLLSIIAIPVIINSGKILELWLINVPQYAIQFLILVITASVFDTLSSTASTAIQATGNIKKFTIINSILLLLEVPIAYILLFIGSAPYYASIPTILLSVISTVYRFCYLHNLTQVFDLKSIILNLVLKNILLFCFMLTGPFLLKSYMPDNFMSFFLSILFSIIWTVAIVFLLGLNKDEKQEVCSKIKLILSKYTYKNI